MTRFVCIHGHFYQPPREDPKTGKIPRQPSAAPFDNWNDRILKECYAANTAVEIVNQMGSNLLMNNYDWISFNIGPTLFSWMEQFHPKTVERIIAAHHRSLERTGHSNAIAQVYHHSILPLADRSDKETEVAWGIADYEKRFGIKPEGMWLAETAVDTQTLEVLVEAGIQYVILAARQAASVDIDGSWVTVDEQSLDTTQPYWCHTDSGPMAVFFYDPNLAMDVAFRGALNNGVDFAQTIANRTKEIADGGLVHFATDGESYGHHHRHGEIALGFCLDRLQAHSDIALTNYGAYLAKYPPSQHVKIVENSSWSCAHGVGRWSTNCGCVIDPALKGQQAWRVDLRQVLNRLRDITRTLFLDRTAELLIDSMVLRHGWKRAELQGSTTHWIQANAKRVLSQAEIEEVYFWMKQQELALKMFTSCGWFFDTATGIEAKQILAYAEALIDHTQQKVSWEITATIQQDLAVLLSKPC